MKKDYKLIIILVLVIGLMVSGIFNLYFGFKFLNSKKETTKQIVCEKEEKNGMDDGVKIINKQDINIFENGEVSDYQIYFVIEYDSEEDYKYAKETESKDDAKIAYNDDLKQITKTYEKQKIQDEKGNEKRVWYLNYQESLENIGYSCKFISK